MQEESTPSRAHNTDVGRHRAPEERGGRPDRRVVYLIVLTVALAGFGLASVSAVTTGTDDSHQAVTAAADEQSRVAAAQRADRSARDAPRADAPAAPPAASADAAASTSPAAAAPAASNGPAATAPAAPSTAPATPSAAATAKPAWVSPIPGAPVTSCYGMRWGVLHAGIDLGDPANTPIHAAGAGTVVAAGWVYSGYGISVVIDHGNGYLTHYAHQNKTVVRVGQKVSAGDIIGYEGSTGDSTGPHLHFEVHKGLWNQVDPAPWMRARGVDLGC